MNHKILEHKKQPNMVPILFQFTEDEWKGVPNAGTMDTYNYCKTLTKDLIPEDFEWPEVDCVLYDTLNYRLEIHIWNYEGEE